MKKCIWINVAILASILCANLIEPKSIHSNEKEGIRMMQANADYTPDYYGDDDTEFNPPPFFSIYDYGPFDYDQYD